HRPLLRGCIAVLCADRTQAAGQAGCLVGVERNLHLDFPLLKRSGAAATSPRCTWSNAQLGSDAAGRDRLLQRLVVPLVLVGIGLGERGHSSVEDLALTEVGADC